MDSKYGSKLGSTKPNSIGTWDSFAIVRHRNFFETIMVLAHEVGHGWVFIHLILFPADGSANDLEYSLII